MNCTKIDFKFIKRIKNNLCFIILKCFKNNLKIKLNHKNLRKLFGKELLLKLDDFKIEKAES